MTPRIAAIRISRRAAPLVKPYALSFTTLASFDALLARVELDSGDALLGEVVPLPGYSNETAQSILEAVEPVAAGLAGRSVAEARDTASRRLAGAPFAASLLLSAFDGGPAVAETNDSERVMPLVAAVSSSSPTLANDVSEALAGGYRTIKVKVGASLADDLAALPLLRSKAGTCALLRFDANQAYTEEQAAVFLDRVEQTVFDQTELVEQPLPGSEWAAFARLARRTRIPLMLDESIWNAADVDQASECGAAWVKVKLCKHGGVSELLGVARRARERGLDVVMGNGVATDVANRIELEVHHQHSELFRGASESSGFHKMREPFVHHRLTVRKGCAVW